MKKKSGIFLPVGATEKVVAVWVADHTARAWVESSKAEEAVAGIRIRLKTPIFPLLDY